MANTIKLKRSSTASDEPTASDLDVGELAVNTADGKLFTKHTDNSIVEISGGDVAGFIFIINLFDLPGNNLLKNKSYFTESLIEFPGH